MSWKKQGFIFKQNNKVEFMMSHAQVPTIHVTDDLFRVFFSPRKSMGKSLTVYTDMDIRCPSKCSLGIKNRGKYYDSGRVGAILCL